MLNPMRLEEIATASLHALFEADPYEAAEFCRDELNMEQKEFEYFGVDYPNYKERCENCEACAEVYGMMYCMACDDKNCKEIWECPEGM